MIAFHLALRVARPGRRWAPARPPGGTGVDLPPSLLMGRTRGSRMLVDPRHTPEGHRGQRRAACPRDRRPADRSMVGRVWDATSRLADIRLRGAELGWQPRNDLAEGLRRTADLLSARNGLWQDQPWHRDGRADDPSVDPFTADTVANGYLYTTDQRLPQQPAGQPSPHRRQPGGNCAGRRVVDIGCGDGTYTSDLFEATGATPVSGLDPAENAVRVAQDKVRGRPITIVVGSAFELPYRSWWNGCPFPQPRVREPCSQCDERTSLRARRTRRQQTSRAMMPNLISRGTLHDRRRIAQRRRTYHRAPVPRPAH